MREWRNLLIAACVAAGAALLAACGASPVEPGETEDTPATYRIDGVLTPGMAEDIDQLVAAGRLDELVLNSSYGDEAIALDIAEAILGQSVTASIDGICLGPCLSIIAVAAERVEVAEGAFYAFAGSSYGIFETMPNADQYYGQNTQHLTTITRSAHLYDRLGLSSQLLIDAFAMLRPISEIEAERGSDESYIVTEHLFWVPSPAVFETYELRFSGALIASSAEADERATPYFQGQEFPVSDPLVFE